MYADKLRAAGVPVDLEIYRGVMHEFIKMGRIIPEARQAHLDATKALRQAFHLTTPTRNDKNFALFTACGCAGLRWTCRKSCSTRIT